MSSQPSDHGSWRLPDNNDNSNPNESNNQNNDNRNVNVNAFHSNINPSPNPNPNPNPSPMFPRAPPASASASNHQPAQASRKRQFRFSVRADIELLTLVKRMNPYGAAHGGRLHKWQGIADTLRASGIDIDFRRARDRTGLLLDQWKEKDLPSLRRSGSGNHEDQVQKESLLQEISEIEQAARPRDNASDWRSRDQVRIRAPQGAPVCQLNAPHQDSAPGPQAALNVMAAGGDHRANKYGSFAGSHHASRQLPPIVQKHETHNPISHPQTDTEPQNMQYGSHHGPPEKQFKNSQGQAVSPRFTQPLFGNPSSPAKPTPLHSQSVDRRSPPRSDMSPYANHHLPLLRQPGQAVNRQRNTHVPGTSALDGSPIHAVVANSPRMGEVHNLHVDPLQVGAPRHAAENENEHVWDRLSRVERRLEEISGLMTKRLEMEERRFQWDQERESKRLQIQQERIAKEYEDRQVEREERRRKEQEEKEERKRLWDLLIRSRPHQKSDGGNQEQ